MIKIKKTKSKINQLKIKNKKLKKQRVVQLIKNYKIIIKNKVKNNKKQENNIKIKIKKQML